MALSGQLEGELKVSAYVPCFNGAHFLPATLSAILSQSYPAKEILVVDDGSTDDTAAVASRYPVKLLRHPRNMGLAAARNTAIAAASGEYIAALDADAAPEPGWLELLAGAITDSPLQCEPCAAATGRLREEFTSSLPDRWRSIIMAQHYGEHPKKDIRIFGCNSLIRKDAILAVGGYDPKFRAAFEDIDFSKRFLGQNYHSVYVPAAVCRHMRKDSADSVLNSCYNWRTPPFELAGAFEDPFKLSVKWKISLSQDFQDMIRLKSLGEKPLASLSLLNMLRTPLKDLLRYSSVHSDDSSLALLFEAFLMELFYLRKAPGMPEPIRAAIENRLWELLAKAAPAGTAGQLGNIRARTDDALKHDCQLSGFYEVMGLGKRPENEVLASVLSEIPLLLQFEEEFWQVLLSAFEDLH